MSEEIKNAVIQQLNIGYNTEEDRLLLKIGMSDDIELAVWLTRKVVKILWRLLQDANMTSTLAVDIESPQARDLMQDFDDAIAAQKLDFTEEYKKRNPVNSEELFLAKDCQIIKTGNGTSTLELVCTNGQTLKVVLNKDLSLALVNMLQLATKESGWDLAFAEKTSLLGTMAANTVLH